MPATCEKCGTSRKLKSFPNPKQMVCYYCLGWKVCARCEKTYQLEDFSQGGKHPWCYSCYNLYQQEYRNSNKANRNKIVQRYRQNKRKKERSHARENR